MEEIKDYVFYTILKNFNGNKLKEDGISYGVKRGRSIDHIDNFNAFLNIDFFPWEGLNLNGDWPTCLEIMSADGNVMIANSSPEIEDIKERMYLIYLPDEPTLFQTLFLEKIEFELSYISIDVGIYGKYKEEFLKRRSSNDFNAHEFLKEYILFHKNKLEKTKLTKRKILPKDFFTPVSQ